MSDSGFMQANLQKWARIEFLEAVRALPDRDPIPQEVWSLSRHAFAGRTAEGRFYVAEAWCDNPAVIAAKVATAEQLCRQGYRIGALPTKMSTRDPRTRRPFVVVPPGSEVRPRVLFDRLLEAAYRGVDNFEF